MRINTLGDLIMYNRNSFRTFPSVYITAANKKFRLKNQLFALFCIFVCGFFSSVYSQNCQNNTSTCDNGIGVLEPKVYDNRSLMIMLDELNKALQNVKVVD